ncbi:MAG: hypothetical protein ACXVYB_18470 [Arthrobacter sp.]
MILLRLKGLRAGAQALFHAATALVLAASLGGCGPAETGLQRVAARQLQQRVLGVSQAAAANDHPAALKALDSLEAELKSVAANGQVSEERRRTIMTTITAVRADLTAAVEAAQAAAVKAAEEAAGATAAAEADKAKADAEAAAKAAQESAGPVVAPAPSPAQVPAPEQGKGNAGKGKGRNG